MRVVGACVGVGGAPGRRGSAGGGQGPDGGEAAGELVGPGPAGGRSQGRDAGAVDEAGGHGEERVLTVRATVSGSTGSPMVAVQRMRLWASTAHWSQAPLAEKLPEGQWSSPEPSLRSRMASSMLAC